MRGKTHVWFGVGAALTILHPPLWGYALVGLGALLPDIDNSHGPLSILTCVKHRTVTHSILAVLVASLINPFLGFGYLSHVILDMFNPTGCPLFWPLPHKYSVGGIVTGSKLERVVCSVFIALTIATILSP